MKIRLVTLLPAAALVGGLGVAHAEEPLTLTDAQMDQVTAGQTTISIPSADSASIAVLDDPFGGAVVAASDNVGNTFAAAFPFIADGAAAVSVDDPQDVLVTVN